MIDPPGTISPRFLLLPSSSHHPPPPPPVQDSISSLRETASLSLPIIAVSNVVDNPEPNSTDQEGYVILRYTRGLDHVRRKLDTVHFILTPYLEIPGEDPSSELTQVLCTLDIIKRIPEEKPSTMDCSEYLVLGSSSPLCTWNFS
jgi:hypothetical protein